MGLTYVRARLSSSMDGPWKSARLLVDTGAYYTVLPRRTLIGLGVRAHHAESFRLGDGRVVERDIGVVYVRYATRAAPTQVVFGGPKDVAVLGALTLEELSLQVDPKAQRLRAKKELPMMPVLAEGSRRARRSASRREGHVRPGVAA